MSIITPAMISKRFTWSYGGRQVCLCGSFTGWTQPIAMTLVAGSSTEFETVCHLPAGYHQYKFLIDGVWKYDEHQPWVTDEFGSINNVILVTPDAVSMVLHSDLDTSRNRLSLFLSTFNSFEVFPESGKVFVLDLKLLLKHAFQVMYEQQLSIAPIWSDSEARISGMLTSSDFLTIFRHYGSMTTNGELSISDWKRAKLQLLHRESFGRFLVQAGPDDSLRHVAMLILQHKISAVPIMESDQLLHLACLSRISQFICKHFRGSREVLPILQQPIGSLSLGTIGLGRILKTLHPNDLLTTAIELLIDAQISSIPIVDDQGYLMDVYSRSDVTSLVKSDVCDRYRLERMTIHEAMQLVYEASGGGTRCQKCLRSDSLYDVLDRLSDPTVRRLVVVEAGNGRRVEGIVTLRDVFSFILS